VAAMALPVFAQDYPTKPIRMIVPVPPPGGVDALARRMAEKLQVQLGQPIVVENRSGAAGNVGAEAVFRAAPDGYTILFTHPSPLVVNKSLFPKMSFDPDLFAPITVVADAPFALVVHPKVPATTVQQLISYARANPDKLNYASGGSGGTSHLSSELFNSMAGVKMTHIPYKGTGPALTDLIAGQVDSIFVAANTALPMIKAGKLRALAVGGVKRDRLLPEVPAMNEVLPGFLSTVWQGMVAPPKTPAAITRRLANATMDALKQPDFAKQLIDSGLEPIGSTPEQMAQLMKEEVERWGKVIRTTGVTAE
jgi:tripartite-type tricarboxylate transporter receptor subunit TctC